MCDCISRIETLLTEKMAEQNPESEIVEEVEFQNKSLVLGKKSSMILNNPVLGRYKTGKRIRRFEVSIFPGYCPYCGEALNLEEDEE